MVEKTPQTLEKNIPQEHDAMTQTMRKVLEKVYCENQEFVERLINRLMYAEGKESINGKWEIKTFYLSGSEIRKFHQDERVIKYILSQVLKRPFKLSFKDRHNLQLVILKGDVNE